MQGETSWCRKVLVSRETSPLASSVVSVTRIQGGTAFNVIPDSVTFGGTIRSLTHEGIIALRARVEATITAQAASLGCTAQLNWMEEEHPYYPPTVNNAQAHDFAADVVKRLLGEGSVGETEPTMGAEDFSFMTQAAPSCMLFLGIRNETAGSVHGLHTPRFTLDEQALPRGAAIHAALALEYMRLHGAVGAGFGKDEL